ncbi:MULTISPECIES: hypothetical protein [Pseudoalteromonas]|uniref:Uncharacterized protein n=1 Tax=Pseudoalteromonas luteoviolacea (strain 2ta16) TaxID=1353533 RepID=V4JHP9_PSEL2|nr:MULTISPECIES: hypothetical protein [Pseudoalteromonas]ESP94447.1 hypothetical protein PL2TA16_00447 [Pseudoalteromonas luteoviolacea 2ta16]KZN32140.1 hypothetical protein N483_03075 [Pseudoalteromonas luteoviolacea NCIMB 1944]MCG7547943.1 hypothetical protein [Pseudoalteromonas sp. Of7M-16]
MTRNKNRVSSQSSQEYIAQVVTSLQQDPALLEIVKANCDYYQQQQFLKKGLKRAIEHLEWVLAADDDITRICQQIMADDHIGTKFRQYPLLFKGVILASKNK